MEFDEDAIRNTIAEPDALTEIEADAQEQAPTIAAAEPTGTDPYVPAEGITGSTPAP
jgi:hypothetical protein